ncbi:MAG: HAMP domain-containing sensor histidine kinase [Pseudomonadota bacterium]
MIGRSFFLQVLIVSLFGLTLFAVLASLAWNAIGDEQFNQGLFERSSALVELLLPPATATFAEQQEAVSRIAGRLEFEATLFDSTGTLIAANAVPSPWIAPTTDPGTWQPMEGQRRWLTVLDDGRVLVIDLDRAALPNETFAVAFTFGLLAVVISGLLYPITRRVTRRLERLQQDVDQIGPENLSARVTVDGNDEIAKLATSFNKSTETIEDLVNRQRLLLANASHELRTPLARIRMGIELLETKNTQDRRDGLRQDIQELDALIDDLITMARFDTGSPKEGWETLDLLDLAKEEGKRNADCTVHGVSALVEGDRRMLQHLLRNLLDNAQLHGHAPIEVHVRTEADGASLTVRDGGSGIPEGEQRKVFEPFFRGKGKQNDTGYGLGLSLVARIAKAHNATVSIGNEPYSEVAVRFT